MRRLVPADYVVGGGALTLILRDSWEKFSPEDLQAYFEGSYRTFLEKIQEIRTRGHVGRDEKRELFFMLETIMDTAEALQTGK